MTRRKMASFVLGALLLAGARLIAVDFVRGDANGDGVVPISDAFRVLAFLFHSYPPPDCMRSADVNDSGVVDSGDVDFIWSFLLLNGLPPPWPFPSPGRDVTHSGEIDCEAYGGGTALEDPAAELKVLDSVVAGGRKAQATITLTVSNSSAIAGFSGRLRVAGDILASVESTPVDLTGTTSPSQISLEAVERSREEPKTSTLFPRNLLAGEELDSLKDRLERDYIVYHYRRLGGAGALCEFLRLGKRQLYRRCARLGIHLRKEREKES